MKQYQNIPDVVWLRNSRTQHLASSYKWLLYLEPDLTKHGFKSWPNRHTDRVLTLAGACVSDPSVVGEEGRGIRGSPEITPELQHKSDIVAPNDPSKKTLLPFQFDPEFSTSCWFPRADGPILRSAAAQQSQQPSATHKQSYLWKTLQSFYIQALIVARTNPNGLK